jgi:hypothetical protein
MDRHKTNVGKGTVIYRATEAYDCAIIFHHKGAVWLQCKVALKAFFSTMRNVIGSLDHLISGIKLRRG